MADQAQSNAVVCKQFFMPEAKSIDFIKEFKALSAEDKEQLGEGIRDGSLTY